MPCRGAVTVSITSTCRSLGQAAEQNSHRFRDAVPPFGVIRIDRGAADADVVVLMIEAHRGITPGVERILDGLADRVQDQPVALAINKIDRVEAPVLLGLTEDLNARYEFAQTFMISAEKGHGVETLRGWLAEQMPEGPWLYPEDQIADLPMRMIAAEITREKLTLRLHQELPYQLTVETENACSARIALLC